MHLHINHLWCNRSHWDGKDFNCRVLVSIRNNSFDENKTDNTDWENCVVSKEVFDADIYDDFIKANPKYNEDRCKMLSMISIDVLKPEIMQWLQDNVKDRISPDARKEHIKGWCVVSEDKPSYRDKLQVNIFFYRRRDALKFIKTWSVYKKPTTYYDYFKGVRKEYNSKTKTLQNVESFTSRYL